MRKWITLLMTLLVGCGSYANANMGQVSFEAGYRQDNIDWRSRFPSDNPFLKSSTKFKDLDIFQIGVHGRSTLGSNFYVRGSGYWGWILDGDFEQKGNINFRPQVSNNVADGELFRIGLSDSFRSTVDDQYVFGVSGAVGYPFFFCDCTLVLAPVLGYSLDQQNLEVNSRELAVDRFDDYVPFEREGNCQNSFNSRWYGPFVGVDFDWRPFNSCFDLWAELEYHWGHFSGKTSDLAVRDNLYGLSRGNRHSDNASAWVFAAGFDYDLCNCWTMGLSVKFQDWSGNRNHKICVPDAIEYLTDNTICNHRVKQNNSWRSYAINLTFGRDF